MMLKTNDSHNMTTGHHDILITAQASVTLCVCFKLTIRLLAYIEHFAVAFPDSPRWIRWIPYCESYFPRRILRGEFTMGNFLWGIHHQEFPRESQWRIHHGEFTMGNSPWIWFPGHSSWIHQFAWGKESDSPKGIPHGEFSCGKFMWIFPVNSPQVSNEQYCILWVYYHKT